MTATDVQLTFESTESIELWLGFVDTQLIDSIIAIYAIDLYRPEIMYNTILNNPIVSDRDTKSINQCSNPSAGNWLLLWSWEYVVSRHRHEYEKWSVYRTHITGNPTPPTATMRLALSLFISISIFTLSENHFQRLCGLNNTDTHTTHAHPFNIRYQMSCDFFNALNVSHNRRRVSSFMPIELKSKYTQ